MNVSEFNRFIESEVKKLENVGCIVKRVRMKGNWVTFHIEKSFETNIGKVGIINSVNVIYDSPNDISIHVRNLWGKSRSYSYDLDEKFIKGFKRNITTKHLKYAESLSDGKYPKKVRYV